MREQFFDRRSPRASTRSISVSRQRLLLLFIFIPIFIGCSGPSDPSGTPRPTGPPPASPTSAATADPTPPQVEARTPLEMFLDERTPEIQVRFSRNMDAQSVADGLRMEPPIPYNLSWDGPVLSISFEEPLVPGEGYSFTITRNAAGLNGVPLGQDYGWSYTLKPLLSSATWPSDDHPERKIAYYFNYPMDTARAEAAFQIDPAVTGTFQWNSPGTSMTFRPDKPLPPGADFVVAFEGPLQDAEGHELPAPEPTRFTSPPPILRVHPQGELTVFAPDSVIKIFFDRPMDHRRTAAALQIDPPVEGTVTWEQDTLTFIPQDGSFQELTAYTVTLADSALDQDGQPGLAEPYSWEFATGQRDRAATFGNLGPNAQVLDADGRRAIQFLLTGQDLEEALELSFDLHQLNLEQFLDRYSSSFRGVAGWERTAIGLEGTRLVRSWQETFEKRESGNLQEVTIPPDVPPGLYILNMSHDYLNDQLHLLLTRNTLMLKQSDDQIVAWVTDINGTSLPGIEVGIYARDGQLLRQGRTDGNGLYRASVDRDPQPLIVIARDGPDVTAAGLSNEWRSPRGFWWGWWQTSPQTPDFLAYIYTDRPIYRPGQTVNYKAIIRADDDAVLSLPQPGETAVVQVRDARDNIVLSEEKEIGGFGTVHGSFQIAHGAMLGDYAVEITQGGGSQRQTFKVQDYRKPDIQLAVEADAESYVVGDTIQINVSANYFSGEPVSNAGLVIRQYVLGRSYPWVSQGESEHIWFVSGIEAQEAATDEAGQYTFTLPAALSRDQVDYLSYSYDWGSNHQETLWGIEVSVDDGSYQSVSGFGTLSVSNAGEEITLETQGFWKAPGRPFTVLAGVQDLAGRPVEGRALTLELRQWNRDLFDYTRVSEPVVMATDASGEASFQLSVDEPGYYQVNLIGTDDSGNPIGYKSGIYIFDETDTWINRRVSDLSISADKDSYRPGETASLIIESPFSGPALLTFERGTTRRELPVRLTEPMTVVEAPIRADDAPNIFVTVNAWEEQDTTLTQDTFTNLPDSRLHTASVELRVPVTDKALTISISADQTVYAPREEASFQVRVTDASGRPVQAEVSLALVDEAIFSLSDELSGPVLEAFYAERPHLVRTYDSMALLRELWGGGRGGGGDEGLIDNPRSDFPDTAVWLPALVTDENGELEVTVPLPDSLTSWRLTAKATTAEDTLVGEASLNVVTQQPIVVRPVLPRSLTAGDEVLISAIVHNHGETAQDLQVSIAASGLEILDPAAQQTSIEAGDKKILGWRARAEEVGEAVVTIRAAAGLEGDAVRLTIPIQPLAIPDFTTQVGAFQGSFTTEIQWPEDAMEISALQVDLNRSIAGSLLTGLEYLTGFPYGCVEQTMSVALPNAVVGRAFHQLGVGSPTLGADLPPRINAGLQRLYGYQHNDGGWGWWFDDQTDAYQTAWVVFGLAVTDQAGYAVDEQVIERGVSWLADHLDGMDIRTRAYALYSM
ncbi:MAG: Ig-like domain-containing protein, partial [Anaerolineales bacterium]|nr:Ig-like domain-containing protein [Anaerolineales bacterium]